MTRDDLFQIASSRGWVRGQPLSAQQNTAIRAVLTARLNGPDADDLTDAPRQHFTEHKVQKMRQMTVDDAVDALMEELV